jgi:hypothetical protein
MTIDSELETWREVWIHPSEVSEQPSSFDIRRALQRKEFRLRALHLLEFAWALFLLGFSFAVARRYPTTEMFVWALVIWTATLTATAYSVWNWRSLWLAERKSTSEYVRIYERHCVAGLRQIRFGYCFLAANLVIVIPWVSWRFFRSGDAVPLSLMAYLISMGLVAGLTVGYLFWFSRSRRNRLRELEQLRRYKEVLSEEKGS